MLETMKRTQIASYSDGFLSWTFPRFGVFKISEFLAIFALPFSSRFPLRSVLRCYGLFTVGIVISFGMALTVIGHGDASLTSEKGIYSSPALVPFVNLLHVVVYLITVVSLTNYFAHCGPRDLSKTLRMAYYLTVVPGLLQIFRIYSGIHFNLPWLERADVGPFSGVFNAGYLRVMGFEIEPLAYASSLIAVCCLSMYNGKRIPWLGMLVLIHTYGVGAAVGLVLALIGALSDRLKKLAVPIFTVCFSLSCWFIYDHFHGLAVLASFSGSASERLGADYACIAMWLDHPMGIGLGMYGYLFNHYDALGLFPAGSLDFYPNNDPAMFLAYGGPLLFAGFLYVFHYILKRSSSYWITVAVLALLIQCTSAYLFFNPAIAVLFSLVLSRAVDPVREPARVRFTLGPLLQFPFGTKIIYRRRRPENTRV